MIKLNDWITSSNTYPERAKSKDLTEEVKANAQELIKKVSALLVELGVDNVKLSSGFRPAAINAAIGNAAKRSLHQTGRACDIIDDKNQSLYKKIEQHFDLLEKYGLWMEHGDSTKGVNSNWVHLDCGARTARKIRIFKP